MIKMRFLLLLLISVLGCQLYAQNPVSIHITEKEGLPDKEFYGILEDAKGFIWLAGNKGLTRFDGTTYKTFEHPQKRGLSMFEPVLDEEQRVWSINISGQLFYAEGETLVLFADLKDILKGQLGNVIYHNGYIYVSANKLIVAIDIASKKKTVIHSKALDSGKFLGHHIITKKVGDQLWYGNEGAIFSMEGEHETQINQLPKAFAHSKERNGVGEIIELPNGNTLYYFQNSQLKKHFFEWNGSQWIPLEIPEALNGIVVTKITFYEDTVWFTTSDGVLTGTYLNGAFTFSNHFLKGVFTSDVTRDQDNNYWVTTTRDGLFVFPNIYIDTIDIPSHFGKPSRMIQGPASSVLIGTTSGDAIEYTAETRTKKEFDLPKGRAISTLFYDAYRNEYGFMQETKSYLAKNLSPNNVSALPIKLGTTKELEFIDAKTIITVNSNSGFELEYPLKDTYPKENAIYSKFKRGYTCFYNPLSEYRYFAMVDELIAVDASYTETEVVTPNNSAILATAITSTEDGTVWAATFQHGVYAIHKTQVVGSLSEDNGLLSNRINSITADGIFLWIATDKGIQQYDTKLKTFKNLKKRDGIPSYSIKDIVTIGNHVFFSSNETVFSIDKNNAFKELTTPTLYITKVSINNNLQPLQDAYQLQQDEAKVGITFNANGLRGLSSGKYEYRLKGLDTEWTPLKAGTNEIQFANLPAGKLTFQLRAQGMDTSEMSPVEIKFDVVVPFYKSMWLWFGLMVALLVFVVYYFRRKIKKREIQKNEELAQLALDNELNSLQLENLRSQMNPHFIFNALNSIQEYIVNNEKHLASSYLVKFSRLIRMYLDQSRENSITLEEEIAAIKLYLELEKVRFEEQLQYRIDVNVNVPLASLYVPSLFIQPYVENALKHGLLHVDERQLDLTFTYNETTKLLQVIVQDNGIGRIASQKLKTSQPQLHKSFATSANERRVTLLNKNRTTEIKVDILDVNPEVDATGTKVVIEIPQG
ncbi:Y_Y_Y domain-containing protein [Ulvibacter litoralis]|uniref:Y_Y_Y domain-containing protein n=2 Tax=Ulvibacter litoralis TaxID=227084 RepID=A0A1G7FHM0_9FLAO|nr:Y_Y_Y domain-containing protein [Ulvibacter litoralis]